MTSSKLPVDFVKIMDAYECNAAHRNTMMRLWNIERVRGYLEHHLGCTQKECCTALELGAPTVSRIIKTIRSKE